MTLYFDHAASSPPWPDVVDSVARTMQHYYANPSSLHKLGQQAEMLLAKARTVIAKALGVEPMELIFTSGGTESNNLAVKGAVRQYRRRGRHIITTQIEHASVYEACRQLELEDGLDVTYIAPRQDGVVDPEDVRRAIRPDTVLVSIMHVNNETGAVQPVETIGKMLQDFPRILFHIDAVQSVGKLPVHPKKWGIDMLSVSAHKMNGPRGAGLLYCRQGLQLSPLLSGGGQESGRRSGTESLPQIAGMAKAIRLSMERLEQHRNKLSLLRKELVRSMEQIPGLVLTELFTASKRTISYAPHIVHCMCPGVRAEVVVHALEQKGVYISTRSACSSGDTEPSAVLSAMGLPHDYATSGLRISLSPEHSLDDVRKLADHMRETVTQLRKEMGVIG